MVRTPRLTLAALALAVVGIAAAQAPGSFALRGRAGAPPGTPDTRSVSGVVTTSGPVVALAADGSRVAIGVGYTDRWCGHVAVWDVAHRKLVPMLPTRCSKPDGWSDVNEVALAGERAAWIRQEGPGNTQDYYVETATIGAPRVRQLSGQLLLGCSVAYCFWSNGGEGDWASNIVGDGDVLVLNSWSSCFTDPSHFPNCPEGEGKADVLVESGALLRVTTGGLHPVVSGLQALFAVSADVGRVLVLRRLPLLPWEGAIWSSGADGSLAVYRSDGRLVATLGSTLGSVRDARLQGGRVAVLTRSAVGVIDAVTAETLRVWSLQGAKNVHLEDIDHGIVVYVAGRTIHLLRLSDGREATITPAPGSGVHAQLEQSGFFYSYGRHVAFISRADLARRFAG